MRVCPGLVLLHLQLLRNHRAVTLNPDSTVSTRTVVPGYPHCGTGAYGTGTCRLRPVPLPVPKFVHVLMPIPRTRDRAPRFHSLLVASFNIYNYTFFRQQSRAKTHATRTAKRPDPPKTTLCGQFHHQPASHRGSEQFHGLADLEEGWLVDSVVPISHELDNLSKLLVARHLPDLFRHGAQTVDAVRGVSMLGV